MQTPVSTNKRSLTITLRDDKYKAERLTKTHYVALAGLVWEKGTMPDLDQTGVRNKIAEQMLYKFGDPEFMKRLCYSLLAIFPTLSNNDLVWFQPEGNTIPPWGTCLEPEEILEVIISVSNALQNSDAGSKSTTDTFAGLQKEAKLAELERAIAELRQG